MGHPIPSHNNIIRFPRKKSLGNLDKNITILNSLHKQNRKKEEKETSPESGKCIIYRFSSSSLITEVRGAEKKEEWFESIQLPPINRLIYGFIYLLMNTSILTSIAWWSRPSFHFFCARALCCAVILSKILGPKRTEKKEKNTNKSRRGKRWIKYFLRF